MRPAGSRALVAIALLLASALASCGNEGASSPPTAMEGDVQGLEAAVAKELKAWTARECETADTMRMDQAVQYTPDDPLPQMHDSAELMAWCQDARENAEGTVIFTPVDYEYRVIGTTGIVYGTLKWVFTANDGSQDTGQHRRMETWVNLDGQWRRLALHMSEVPPGG